MRRYSPLLLALLFLAALCAPQLASAAAAQPAAPSSFDSPLLTPRAAAPEPTEEAEEEGEDDEVGEFELEEEVLVEECEASADDFEFESAAEEKEFEEEVAECEREAKKGKGGSFVSAPEECVVQHAESTITTLPAGDRVRLTVHYASYSPAAVAIGLKLKDHKGSLALEHTTRHLGRGGTLHLTTKLGEGEMERAEDAREFDVALRAPGTPGYCTDLLEQHLTKTGSATKGHGSSAHRSRVYAVPHQKNG